MGNTWPGFTIKSTINDGDIGRADILDFSAATCSSCSSQTLFLNYEANEFSESGSNNEEKSAFKVKPRK